MVTLLILWLPALVGGARLDEPPRPGELPRLEDGLDPAAASGPISWPLSWFYVAALPADATAAPSRLLPQARLASVVGLLAISSLLYVLLVLTRRRTTGLLACFGLVVLPPVFRDGHVLRPEVPAAVFSLLAMVVVVGFPIILRRRSDAARWLSMLACGVVVGAATGLAAASVSRAAVLLLVPGSALVLLCGALALAIGPLLRRRPIERMPNRAMNRRLVPWVVLSLVNMMVAMPVLQLSLAVDGTRPPIELPPTVAQAGLLPASPFAAIPLLLLAGLGGLRLILAVGLRLPRLRRVTPDALLLIYVAVTIAQYAFGEVDTDALVAAPAMAVLLAEGAVGVLLLVLGRKR
jgi:hypothetical protein